MNEQLKRILQCCYLLATNMSEFDCNKHFNFKEIDQAKQINNLIKCPEILNSIQ